MPETLDLWLERAAGAADDAPRPPVLRLVDRRERETTYSWREIRRRAVGTASRLRALGVEPRDRVALVFPTSIEFFDAFFGILLAGAVPTPLYPPIRLGRIDEYEERTAAMLRAVDATLVVADGRVRRLLGRAVEPASPRLGCRTLSALPESDTASFDPYAASSEELALVQFSSGTTTDPKPVALTHRAVCAQARILNGLWPDTDEKRQSGLSWLPLYHDMGLIGCVFPALERPADLTLLPPEAFLARPALWLRAISRHRATISPAPDFAYALAAERIEDAELDGVDLSSWCLAIDGAESVSATTLERFAARFAPWGFDRRALTPVYGLSEAALAVTFSELDRGPRTVTVDRGSLAERGEVRVAETGRTLVSVGRTLPGFEIEIRDEDGNVAPPRREGRLWVRGPSLMAGYLDRPEATAEAMEDGWLDTGDLGVLLDGELFITGRAKDVLVVRGKNRSPEEIERAVDQVEGSRTGCAIAVALPRDDGGEEIALFVEHARTLESAGEGPTLEALGRRCREAVAASCGVTVDRVVVVAPGTLPRTSSGKMRRAETQRRYRRGELDPPDRTGALRLTAAVVRSQLAFARARARGDDG